VQRHLFVYAITAADGLAVGAAAPASRLALSATIAAAIMIHKASHGLHFVLFCFVYQEEDTFTGNKKAREWALCRIH
jgi:hypothetical protein